jgi:hypothetical protein
MSDWQWILNNLQGHLTDNYQYQGDAGIDSVQNGILLDIKLHYLWDNCGVSMYPLSTNPVCPSFSTNKSHHIESSSSREDLSKGHTMAESFNSITFKDILPPLLSSCMNTSNKRSLQT